MARSLNHLGFVELKNKPVTIYCDSMAILTLTKDPKYDGKTKYMKIKYNFFRYAVEENEFHLTLCKLHVFHFIVPLYEQLY